MQGGSLGGLHLGEHLQWHLGYRCGYRIGCRAVQHGELVKTCWLVGAREWFIGELKNMGGEGSFYSLGGVPGQWRILLQEAKSLLQQSSLSIGQGIAVGMGFLCDE